MEEILHNNLALIEKRWPNIFNKFDAVKLDSLHVEIEQNTLLVNGIQLTSNIDRESEAKLQAGLIPKDSEIAYVYGIGLGDLPALLVQRPCLKQLIVCILNIDLLVHVANVVDLTSWLSNIKVVLVDFSSIKDVYTPFSASPSDLILAQNSAAQLRDRIVLELDSEFIRERHKSISCWFTDEIEKNKANIMASPGIDACFIKNSNKIYIAAAGPTLKSHIFRLKENQKSNNPIPLIAVDAALKPLLLHDIVPDLVVTLDHASHLAFEGVDFSLLKSTALVFFPVVDANIPEQWAGKKYCAYTESSLYAEVDMKYPRGKLFSSGSVIHPTVDLAVQKGAKSVVLLGADFGFPNDETYACGQEIVDTEHYIESADWVLNGREEKITTMPSYRGYLRDLERYIEDNADVKFINGSIEGAKISGTILLKNNE